MGLELIIPREGTETNRSTSFRDASIIRTDNSPRGDGNTVPVPTVPVSAVPLELIIPREGTETVDTSFDNTNSHQY